MDQLRLSEPAWNPFPVIAALALGLAFIILSQNITLQFMVRYLVPIESQPIAAPNQGQGWNGDDSFLNENIVRILWM